MVLLLYSGLERLPVTANKTTTYAFTFLAGNTYYIMYLRGKKNTMFLKPDECFYDTLLDLTVRGTALHLVEYIFDVYRPIIN